MISMQKNQHKAVIGVNMMVDDGLRTEAKARGWNLMSLEFAPGIPQGVSVQGVLSRTPIPQSILDLHQAGVPVVGMGLLPSFEDATIPDVICDQYAEGRMAADHYYERGFRDVGFFGMDPWGYNETLFYGFRDRAEELGLHCQLGRFPGRYPSNLSLAERQADKKRVFTERIKTLPMPIGLLAPNPWFAASFCAWAIEAGFNVPFDIAVMTVDDETGLCESAIPSITTVEKDIESRSRKACEQLDRMISGREASMNRVLIPPKSVTERESTDVLATNDRVVADALRYMWGNLRMNMSIEDVASQVGLSSRQLERRFRAELGRGVNAELQRKRLQELCRLLVSTHTRVADLAALVGYRSVSYMHEVFRKAFGTSPGKYRRERTGA